MQLNIKNGLHNHKAIAAANIVLCTWQHSSVFKKIFYTAWIMLRCML